jgi:hypothetical protein
MIKSINKYRNELKKIIDFGESLNETTIYPDSTLKDRFLLSYGYNERNI